MVGCNSISKIILSDPKIKAKMPVLAVQIDDTFISLNIYENNQLSFSRFASISPEDYGNDSDYVFKAVSENVFRMLQFHKARGSHDVIENVIIYGDTRDNIRITTELDQMDIATSIIPVPSIVSNYECLEFSVYANAIGAMFRRNKDYERVNLLETDSKNNSKIKQDSSFGVMLLGVMIACGIAYGGIGLFFFKMPNDTIKSEIKAAQDWIKSPDTIAKQEEAKALDTMKSNVLNYKTMATNAYDAYRTKFILDSNVLQTIIYDRINTCKEWEEVVQEPYPGEYEMTEAGLKMKTEWILREAYAHKFPLKMVEWLEGTGIVYNIDYAGYKVEVAADRPIQQVKVTIEFEMQFKSNVISILGKEEAAVNG
jgi:type IV pilus assembly protein PilM